MGSWINYNIFRFRKVDAVFYFFLYILAPILLTAISLWTLNADNIAKSEYCFLTIIISAFNCMYDCFNRWDSTEKSIVNTKLFIIGVSTIVIIVYCIVKCFVGLSAGNINVVHCDWILWIYLFPSLIALIDIIACFIKNMALHNCISTQ